MKYKYGNKVVAYFERFIFEEQFEVIVVDENKECSDGNKYYNVHIISEQFKDEKFNTLQLQIPHSCIKNPKEYFDTKYMIARLMEHIIWCEFYDLGVVSSSVKIHEIAKH